MKKLFLTIIAMFAMSASMAQVTFTKNINSDSPMTKSSFSETTSLQYTTIDENTVALSGYSGGITVLDIPSTVTHDGTDYTVTEIADNAFEECASLTEVRCPATVTRIGKAAFKKCENLETVTFAENSQLKNIDDDAFVGVSAGYLGEDGRVVVYSNKITTIDIPASVERIGKRAFRYCKELEEVNFSEQSQLKIIDERAFSGGGDDEFPESTAVANKIREFNFPASVETVGDYIFGYAIYLETVNIPESSLLDTISGQMFYQCAGLRDTIYIPSGVTGIGNKAFMNCFHLPAVIFAENSQVEKIGSYAFEYCVRMTDIKLPASLEIIEYYGFRDCDALVSLEFEEGSQLKKIGKYAFINCDALDTVTIPANVEYIDYQVFWNCPNLNVVRFLGQNPPVFHGGSDSNLGTDHFFNNTPDTKVMLVPFGRYDAYKDLPTDIRATFARIYEEIPEGETGTISNEYKITANKGLINDGTLVIAAGGEFVNETEDADFGSVEVVSPNAVAGAWNFVGAPFGDYNLDAVKITDTDVAVKLFNFETGAWQSGYATFDDEVSAGEGFYAWPFNTVTTPITFKTAKNEGDEHYTLNNDYLTITKPVVENEGNWMALANPYTFKLDVGIFLSDQENVQGNCVYTLENGTFACKELGAAINVTEGFFVNFVNDGPQTAYFKTTQRSTSSKKASTEREFVRLSMLDGERSVELLFAQNDDANESYDIYDANKLFSPAEIAEPYFLTDGIALVKEEVNTLPYYAKMNVRSYEGKEVKFKADYIPEGLSVSIIDGEEMIDLTEGAEYTTEISSGENADRFKVLIKKNVGMADVEELDVRITNSNRNIAITAQEEVKVEVYNTLGQKVYETNETDFVLSGVASGAYVVKVQGNKASKSQKIVVE